MAKWLHLSLVLLVLANSHARSTAGSGARPLASKQEAANAGSQRGARPRRQLLQAQVQGQAFPPPPQASMYTTWQVSGQAVLLPTFAPAVASPSSGYYPDLRSKLALCAGPCEVR